MNTFPSFLEKPSMKLLKCSVPWFEADNMVQYTQNNLILVLLDYNAPGMSITKPLNKWNHKEIPK